IGARIADATELLADAVADGVEAIARGFLEGQDKIASEEDADLFRLEIDSASDHPADDIDVIAVEIHLGALGHRHHVFEGEAMEFEYVADLADDLFVAVPVHVDPGHRPL